KAQTRLTALETTCNRHITDRAPSSPEALGVSQTRLVRRRRNNSYKRGAARPYRCTSPLAPRTSSSADRRRLLGLRVPLVILRLRRLSAGFSAASSSTSGASESGHYCTARCSPGRPSRCSRPSPSHGHSAHWGTQLGQLFDSASS